LRLSIEIKQKYRIRKWLRKIKSKLIGLRSHPCGKTNHAKPYVQKNFELHDCRWYLCYYVCQGRCVLNFEN